MNDISMHFCMQNMLQPEMHSGILKALLNEGRIPMTMPVGSVNVRVSKQTHQQLAALARENGLSMQTILDRAVKAYRRQSFLEALNAVIAAWRPSKKDGRR